MLRLAFALVIVIGGVAPAPAASFTKSLSGDGHVVISLEGRITKGDALALESAIRDANAAGRMISGLRLHSPGGDADEGIALAKVVRDWRLATVVVNGTYCASACFDVFAAGREKYVSFGARLGVHGASDGQGRETTSAKATTVDGARFAQDLGVPAAIIGKMVVTPASQMLWLTPDDLRSMGVVMTGRPVDRASADDGFPTPPTTPRGRRAAADRPFDAMGWEELVGFAIRRSSEQHGGAPQVVRGCDPKRQCSAILFSDDDKGDMMVRRTEDRRGQVVERSLCQLNAFGDVRTCYVWDSTEVRTEMKNGNGVWTVAE